MISLITDFGLTDWFVGAMKAVIYSIQPRATIVDLTHGIPSGDVQAGAFALAAAYRFCPRRTIHVVVVDPGVGSKRAALAVQTSEYIFVGPDNGVLSWALAEQKILTIRRLENPKYFLQPVSQTFHGRDIFAPVAAHLAKGLTCARLGPAQADYVRLPRPNPQVLPQVIRGEIVYIDRFGNAITNIPNHLVQPVDNLRRVSVGTRFRCPLASFYQAVAKGQPVAVPGSSGFLEIAVNGGNAAQQWSLKVGSQVKVSGK